jgi:hypothetical protein
MHPSVDSYRNFDAPGEKEKAGYQAPAQSIPYDINLLT